ncbi:hypothetical protein [Streptococcus suis]|uniref:hypothetical protein n=1 Tax=Streptococcus suis TaxID=1307 RepID=UPI000CF5CA6A|nr:hypothetical protein [Streptococcus suis]
MDKYITIDLFIDTDDDRVEYPIGALYPREGYTPSKERIDSLLSGDNARGVPLIKQIIELPAKTTIPSDAENELTRDAIKEKLTQLGIEFNTKAKTESLLKLLKTAEEE